MTALRGDTPKHKDIVKKYVLNYKVSIKREGRSRGGLRKNRSPATVSATPPTFMWIFLGWGLNPQPKNFALRSQLLAVKAVQLCRQQLIGHFRIGAATGFFHHLTDKKAQELGFAGSVLFELLGVGG